MLIMMAISLVLRSILSNSRNYLENISNVFQRKKTTSAISLI